MGASKTKNSTALPRCVAGGEPRRSRVSHAAAAPEHAVERDPQQQGARRAEGQQAAPSRARGTCSSVVSRRLASRNQRRRNHSDTFTRPISTGTSTSGPITAAKAAPWWMPKVATATAMASSKLFEAAVNESVADCG